MYAHVKRHTASYLLYSKLDDADAEDGKIMRVKMLSLQVLLILMICLMIFNRFVDAFQGSTIVETSRRRRFHEVHDVVRTTVLPRRAWKIMPLLQQHQQHERADDLVDDSDTATTILLERDNNSEVSSMPIPPSNVVAIVASSPSLGRIWRIRMPGHDDEQDYRSSSVLGSMGVPTFAATGGQLIPEDDDDERAEMEFYSLQDALGQGPAFILKNVLDPSVCRDIINTCERRNRQRHHHEYQPSNGSSISSSINSLFGSYNAGKNHHGAMQIVVSNDMIQPIAKRMEKYINLQEVEELQRKMSNLVLGEQQHHGATRTSFRRRLQYAGLNQRWRIYRYAPSGQERFAPHIDAGFPPSGLSQDGKELIWDMSSSSSSSTTTTTTISHLTILFYLNDDFEGGETNFYQPLAQQQGEQTDPVIIASVNPVTGSCLVFPQGVGEEAVEAARRLWPLHEGAPVLPLRQLQQQQLSSSSSSLSQEGTGIENLYNPTEAEASSPKYVIRSDILFTSVPETTSKKV
jgi:hypothetical protein